MAHKKGAGSSRNGRDSNAQRQGVKRFGDEFVIPGNIIVRQHGTHFYPVRVRTSAKITRFSPSFLVMCRLTLCAAATVKSA